MTAPAPIHIKLPEQWGWCFRDGINEQAFTQALAAAVRNHQSDALFQYLEIGLGVGDTLRAVDSILDQMLIPYSLTGVDLPGWTNDNIPVQATISTLGSVEFLKSNQLRYDFVFIDGCHGFPCVMRDFRMVEPWVVNGGIVCFHDTSPICQGHHLQPHCGTGIDARAAVARMGLLDDSRPGWKRIMETYGNPQAGSHGCLFVQKTL